MINKDSLPALLGGSPAVTLDQICANRWPIFTQEDEDAVVAIIRDGDLSTHPVVRELESDYCRYFDRKFALAHSNGTSALMAAFFAIDLKPGDEVIVPSATWWASVVPALWVGAIPVFAESEEQRGGLDPDDVVRKLTSRTKAIVVVHLWGMPSKMTQLLSIAEKHKLKVIEDASHAHGATWNNRKCGQLGDVSVFSLQGHKLAPAGEGGMLLTDQEELFERTTLLGDTIRIAELPSAQRRFYATTFGIKTRMAPLSAAIARVQLSHLDERNALRNANLEYLSNQLEDLDFETYLPPAHIRRVYFEFLIRPRSEAKLSIPNLVKALLAEGCHVGQPRYPLLHQQPLFTEGEFQKIIRLPETSQVPIYQPNALPKTEALTKQMLRLPSFPQAEKPLLDQYVHAFRKVLQNADEISAALK